MTEQALKLCFGEKGALEGQGGCINGLFDHLTVQFVQDTPAKSDIPSIFFIGWGSHLPLFMFLNAA